MPLQAWLDAGYAMLIDGADALWRQLLEGIFAAESPAELERAFDALKAESAYRQAQNEKQEREHRRKTGAPTHARLLPKDQIEEAFAEWEELTAGGPGSSPAAEPSV